MTGIGAETRMEPIRPAVSTFGRSCLFPLTFSGYNSPRSED